MRTWTVRAFFPEIIPAHCADQSCTVTAQDIGDAARRGIDEIRRSDALRGKHITVVKLVVACVEPTRRPNGRRF